MTTQQGVDKIHAAGMADEHAIQQVPKPLPIFRGNVCTTEHTFYWTNRIPLQTNTSASTTDYWTTHGMEDRHISFLDVTHNYLPFIERAPIYIPDTFDIHTSNVLSRIYSGNGNTDPGNLASVYWPNGVDPFMAMYKYFKIESRQTEIEIMNVAGVNLSTLPMHVRIGSYTINKIGNMPSMAEPVNGPSMAAIRMDPMYHPTCGDAILGTPCQLDTTAGSTTGITSSHALAPVFRTTMNYDASTMQAADDPTMETKLIEWIPTTNPLSLPGNPVRTVFWFTPAFPSTNQKELFLPAIRIKCKVRISWRDLYDNTQSTAGKVLGIGTKQLNRLNIS